jgi:aminoglycoside/choline kinase family phosphotransferase
VVVKFPAGQPEVRRAGVREMVYDREIEFYSSLAPVLDVRAPRCLHIARGPESGEFALVLEDLGPAVGGDQIAGCGPDRAEAVMDAAAGLHAPMWGRAGLEDEGWNIRPAYLPRVEASYPGLFEAFSRQFGGRLAADDLAIGEVFAPVVGRWFAGQPRPWTLVHGDFRLDNMLFDIRGGAEPVGVLDWQTIMPGPGVADVSYFLGGCLPVADRRAHEQRLLRRYHQGLLDRGVTGYPYGRCEQDYRYTAFLGYFMASYAPMLVPRTERGDEMFAVWLERTATQIRDLDAMDLLPR